MKSLQGHTARKRFGQNFLHDAHIIRQIVDAISPKNTDHIVEIGPGLGAITEYLTIDAARLDVIEIDRDLIPRLQEKFGMNSQFQIHESDALKFNFAKLLDKSNNPASSQLRIVGNLPYNISTPLLFHLFSFPGLIEDMHFMLQKEVVERMAAPAGSPDYGRLSIMAQYHSKVDMLFTVPPGAFNPAPKVDSAIVRLQPYKQPKIIAKNVKHFEKLVTQAFTQRRKTIRNSLKTMANTEQLEHAGISPELRPEVITLTQYVTLSNLLQQNNSN
ncbi:16S rRNA (adenine(1518)-N(6)/adenine(1519)-N(6))-dimethyltransferase RsmA [Piscirickettsia litoralis]|uniref:Ribosomal RNA small subunit methyltransferase A n=1 Tax=Piscirickettsia litoralis TaxID=1891921 RepID=A0ABX3A548_9GAMM|nr:16S rRNA (adenine(1518)-N(6)/adenine(1519)-N(6))-dimethyltransferase RsmA [Piscirickettsia litoralis]ODN42545.1 16S rRNA (adenine(1518)-N(6)/adenine(1519)-N(6))-dimethyltransferase [Piscirickettsia litoralis]